MRNGRYFKHFLNENIILKQHVDEHFVFFQASPAHMETPLFSSQGSVTRCKTLSTRNESNAGPKPFIKEDRQTNVSFFNVNFRYNLWATISISIYLSGLEFSHTMCKVICVQDPSRIFQLFTVISPTPNSTEMFHGLSSLNLYKAVKDSVKIFTELTF